MSSLAVQPDERSTSPAPPTPRLRRPDPRIVPAALGVALVVVALVSGSPVALLLGLVLAATSVARRWLPLDLAVPSAVLACLAVAVVAGLLASAAGTSLLAHPTELGLAFLLCSALALADAVRRGAAADAVRLRAGWVAYVPAAMAVAIAWVQAATTWTAMTWSFVGTDMAQHMLLLEDLQRSGRLDYAVNGYPRAVHLLLALVSGPSMPADPVTLLPYDLRLMAAATWLAFALMIGVAAGVTMRVARLLGATDLVSVGAATVCGAGLLLFNQLVLSFVYMGAAPSLLAMVVLWALPLAALELDRRDVPRPGTALLVVAAASVALLGHLWQPLAVVPVVALCVVAVGRRPRTAGRLSPRFAVLVVVAGLVAVAVPAPAVLSVLQARGLATAAITGTIPSMPLALLLGGIGSTAWLAHRRRTASTRAFAGTAAGLVAVAVVLMLGSGRMDVTEYYVAKPLWFLGVAILPVLAAVGAIAVSRVLVTARRLSDRLGSMARIARVFVAASAVALVVAFVLPIEAVAGSAALDTVTTQQPTTRSGRNYTTAVAYATRFAPAVTVPVELGSGPFPNFLPSLITSKLMSFMTGQPQNDGQPLMVCADVRTVAGSRPAVVITTLDPAALAPVMRAGGCPDVRVVRVPGPRRTLAFPLDPTKAVVAP